MNRDDDADGLPTIIGAIAALIALILLICLAVTMAFYVYEVHRSHQIDDKKIHECYGKTWYDKHAWWDYCHDVGNGNPY